MHMYFLVVPATFDQGEPVADVDLHSDVPDMVAEDFDWNSGQPEHVTGVAYLYFCLSELIEGGIRLYVLFDSQTKSFA